MSSRRNILVVGVSSEEYSSIAPFLERKDFEVDRFPSGAGAIELITHVGIDVLLVRYPLPDLALEDLLAHIRRPGGPCQSSPVVLMATYERTLEAQGYIGRGANRVIDLATADVHIQEMLSGLLSVAPRKSARFLARLEIKLGGASDMMLCQTENLSETGMLIKTDRRYESGTEIHFEFTLPNDKFPISGVAEIVRHTMIGRDKVGGVGVRFRSFRGDSQKRYENFVFGL